MGMPPLHGFIIWLYLVEKISPHHSLFCNFFGSSNVLFRKNFKIIVPFLLKTMLEFGLEFYALIKV